jgi:hypothetical protein
MTGPGKMSKEYEISCDWWTKIGLVFEVICLMQMSVKPRIFIIQKAAIYITKILSIFGKFLNAFIVRLVHCISCSICVV